jgi:hypothetical protein
MNDLGFGKSIYMKKQLDKFAAFKDSQGTRRAYLVETAELAYNSRNKSGEWVLTFGLRLKAR